jgi:hypothetical protein
MRGIGDLACRQDEADRIAEGVDGNADLRAQAAAQTPDRTTAGSVVTRFVQASVPSRGSLWTFALMPE